MIDTIIQGDCLDVMKDIEDKSINCIITSPPYWGLRDYGIEGIVWDGDPECNHNFNSDGAYHDNMRYRAGESTTVGNNLNPEIYTHFLHRGSTKSKVQNKSSITDGKTSSQFCSLCGEWKGSLGLEPTFELYIKHLIQIFDECKRILKDDGTLWVNIGHTYASNGSQETRFWHGDNPGKHKLNGDGNLSKGYSGRCRTDQIKSKSLCDIPFRFSIAMIDSGWIKRNTLIWHKPNCMPASAKDRFTVDFEYVFFFTKSKRYWFEQQFEPFAEATLPRMARGVSETNKWVNGADGQTKHTMSQPRPNLNKIPYAVQPRDKDYVEYRNLPDIKELAKYLNYWRNEQGLTIEQIEIMLESRSAHHWFSGESYPSKEDWYKIQELLGFDDEYDYAITTEHIKSSAKTSAPQGRNKRCVWSIPTKPFSEAHFATFPEALIQPMILAGCPEFVCTKCGKPREKIYKDGKSINQAGYKEGHKGKTGLHINASEISSLVTGYVKEKIENGYTDCGCGAGFDSGIVFDPFMGAGTVAVVAKKLNRHWLGSELNPEYVEMAERRLKQPSKVKRIKQVYDSQPEFELQLAGG